MSHAPEFAGLNSQLVASLIVGCGLMDDDAVERALVLADDADREPAVVHIEKLYRESPTADRVCAWTFRHLRELLELSRTDKAPPKRQSKTDQKRLASMIFRLMRSGEGAIRITEHTREANAKLAKPLPEHELRKLILWCAERHKEERVGVGR